MAPNKIAKIPLHQQISDALRAELRSGLYAVGDAFPTEEALTQRFSASRPTVRQALASLSEAGLIARRARTGAIVINTEPESVLTHKVNTVGEFFNYPAGTVRSLVSTANVSADRALAVALRCEPGMAWRRISLIRRSATSSVPLSWQDVYLLPEYGAVADHPELTQAPIYSQVARLYAESIDEAEVEVVAGKMPAKLARIFEVERGSPALIVTRRFYGKDGRNFETSISTHPYQRFKYSFRYMRESLGRPKR